MLLIHKELGTIPYGGGQPTYDLRPTTDHTICEGGRGGAPTNDRHAYIYIYIYICMSVAILAQAIFGSESAAAPMQRVLQSSIQWSRQR